MLMCEDVEAPLLTHMDIVEAGLQILQEGAIRNTSPHSLHSWIRSLTYSTVYLNKTYDYVLLILSVSSPAQRDLCLPFFLLLSIFPSCLLLSLFLPACLPLSFLPLPICLSVFSTLTRLYMSLWLSSVACLLSDYRLYVCLLFVDCLPVLTVCLLSASLAIVRVPVCVSGDLSACLSLWLSSVCMSLWISIVGLFDSLTIVCMLIYLSNYHLSACLCF